MIRDRDAILFIGDSITHGHRRPEEIHDVYNLGHGYVSRLAGRLRLRLPRWQLTIHNRGVCGDNVRGMLGRWHADCYALAPSVISILMGVNDSWEGSSDTFGVDFYEQTYRTLLLSLIHI
jgi:acyl-CoA thioesterase-1